MSRHLAQRTCVTQRSAIATTLGVGRSPHRCRDAGRIAEPPARNVDETALVRWIRQSVPDRIAADWGL